MSTYLITGTSKGIGLELIRQLVAHSSPTPTLIFALTRSASPTPALQSLITEHPDRITHVEAAVNDSSSVAQAARFVRQVLEERGLKGLEVLINNAAIQAKSENGRADGYNAEVMGEVFNTNVLGVQRVTTAFLPLLMEGKERKVINVTSTLGSMTWANHFAAVPGQAYKVSKAALNMLNKQYALDYADQGFTFLCVSPGNLRTDLGGEGDFAVDVGTAELRRIILAAGPEQNGKALNIHMPGWEEKHGRYDGKEIPW